MSLDAGKKRFEKSLIVPLMFASPTVIKWIYETIEVEKAKNEDFDLDDLKLVVTRIRDENGVENIYFTIHNVKTGTACGNFNDSHPCPPWDLEHCVG